MKPCDECLRLENRLQRASEHYVSLILQHDQMIGDSNSEDSALENLMRDARRRRNAAARLLLAHRGRHEHPVVLTPGHSLCNDG